MSRVKLTQDNKAVEQIQPYAVLYRVLRVSRVYLSELNTLFSGIAVATVDSRLRPCLQLYDPSVLWVHIGRRRRPRPPD